MYRRRKRIRHKAHEIQSSVFSINLLFMHDWKVLSNFEDYFLIYWKLSNYSYHSDLIKFNDHTKYNWFLSFTMNLDPSAIWKYYYHLNTLAFLYFLLSLQFKTSPQYSDEIKWFKIFFGKTLMYMGPEILGTGLRSILLGTFYTPILHCKITKKENCLFVSIDLLLHCFWEEMVLFFKQWW